MKHSIKNTRPTGLAYLIVPGMGSDHCAGLVKESLMRLKGVDSVESNIALHRISVAFNTQQLQLMDLQRAVEKGGYEVDSISGENAAQLTLTVPGMGSDHCAGLIETSIRRLPGIYTVTTHIGTHKVVVDFDHQCCSADVIEQAVVKAGYEVRYVKEAIAAHSHNYTLSQSYRRHFGEGKADAWIFRDGEVNTSFLRFMALPFGMEVLRDLVWACRTGSLDAIVHSVPLRLAQKWGRWRGLTQGLTEYSHA